MADLVGKWDYVSAENLEDYMKAAGVPDNLREMAKNSKPVLDISNAGNSWTIKTTVSEKVKDTTFNIGEEFDSVALTGQPQKCLVTLEGGVMTETQKIGDVTVTVTREVADGQLVSKMTVNGVTASVVFKKA